MFPRNWHFVLLFFLPLCFCRVPDIDENAYSVHDNNCVKENEHCFHQPEEACPSPESKCRCRILSNCSRSAICCNVNKFELTEGLACANVSIYGYVEALHVRNASLDVLNLTQAAWRRLKYMTITDGNISSVIGEFAKHSAVSCLNLSSNGIGHFDNRSLVNLYNLSFLDLSNNNLSDVPRFKKEGNVTLDLSANQKMLCANLLDALKRSELHFRNENNTNCLTAKTFHWFNSTEFLSLSQIIGLHQMKKDCYKDCTCDIARIDMVIGKNATFSMSVNCSNLGLVQLPAPLPRNTVYLNVANNSITSLESLKTDSTYQHVRELIADNNKIDSILPLEGSHLLSNLVGLSLRNNSFESFPIYIFSNVIDRNNIRMVKLGLNRLNCDCNTARVLKVWLSNKHKNIPDYDEIFCKNMDVRVVDLNSMKLCQSQNQDWTDYIYYIITGEVLLLVGLVAKVFYDYWVFKTSGYLPWPASKMPKLPCDWLCE